MVEYAEMTACAHLPRSWVTGAVCPVCGDTRLSIDPQVDRADQMVCTCCTTAFEVAMDGLHVHLVRMPVVLPERVKELWYRPGELHELVVQSSLAIANLKADSVTAIPLEIEELSRRALELRKLGNRPERIESILKGLPGAKAEDVQLVMRDLQVIQDRRERGVLRWAYVLLVGLVLIVGLVAFSVSQGVVLADILRGSSGDGNPLQFFTAIFHPDSQSGTNQAGSQTQSDSQFLDSSLLPPVLQTAIPNGMKILKPPEVVIIQGRRTGKIERCPASVVDAVRLFGGEMKIWSKSRGGWTMISTASQIIFIPEGMTGGYLIYINKPEFYSVPGPVTIENLNFLAISCE